MVSCKHCHTPNSVDSTFCKRCGTSIPEDDLKEAQAKLERLIEEGNTLFNQGRTDEALAIAESVTLSNPSSSSALSLKALCHERRGEVAEALECADRLVELNPDSDFDRIRRATLRQKLQNDLMVPAPDRKMAYVAATAAIVLVLCGGAIAAKAMNGSSTPKTVVSNTQLGQAVSPPNTPQRMDTTGQTNPAQTNPAPSNQTAPTNQVNPSNQGNEGVSAIGEENEPAPRSSRRIPGLPPTAGDSLPVPGFDQGSITTVTPVTPPQASTGSGGQVAKPDPNKSQDHGQDDPVTEEHSNPTQPAAQEAPQGTVQITVHPGSSTVRKIPTGSEPVSGTGLQALLHVGSQQYQLGNYEAAAKSYEQAIQSGGDGVIINRRLASAYAKLGRRSDAADAYKRCISSIDAELKAGRGDRNDLMSKRDLCLQELKVNGG